MKNKLINLLIIICSSVLLFTACADNIPDDTPSSSTVENSASEVILPQYTPKLMEESKPYVLSNMPMSMDDPYIDTQDNTLPFPVYHDKYGSYFIGKRGGYFYYNEDKDIRYIGLMMEDGQVRYFNDNIYHNGYDNLDFWEGCTHQTQPWEKFYFWGCISAELEIDTLSYMMTMIDCRHPERGPDLEYYDNSWGICESGRKLIYYNEDEMLDYLLTTEEYAGCEKILSYFGRKCIYNPYTDTYTFADEKWNATTVGFKEIHGWTGRSNYSLQHNAVLIDQFSLSIEQAE